LPDWLIERGIGEARFALIEDGAIVEARIALEGAVRAGAIVAARLVSAGRNAVARDESGAEYLLPRGAPGVTEGAALTIEVSREAIPGGEPWKRPLAKATVAGPAAAPAMAGRQLSLPSARDELGAAGWDDLVDEARNGVVTFAGGELRLSPTPAMTLIDVDVAVPSEQSAVHAAHAAARAILRLGVAGSIGIDFPTISGRTARASVAQAIDDCLPQPFERTGLNGFGFLQIVRPRRHASLIELAQDRAAFEARALLRRAAFEPAGAKRLVAHPAVIAVLTDHPEWLDALARQVGGAVGLRADPSLPMSAGYAEPA